VTFNGSSLTQLVPVLAQSWTMEPNGTTYVFIMRNDAYFSNGDPINATTAWFNFYRTIIMAQGPGVSNYEGILANFEGPFFLPVGARHAVQSAFHLSSLPSPNQTAAILSQVLSNFNVHNSTIEALMEYRNQSIVVLNSSAIEFNLIHPYAWFASDIAAGGWGALVDPAFVDAHGGVQANQPNSYINTNGAIGSGPYVIASVGSEMSSITLKASPNYWAAKATNVPSVIAPAKIQNVIIEYGASHSDRLEEFDTNQAQLSFVSIPYFGDIYSGYEYAHEVPFSAILNNKGLTPGVGYIALNNQVFPTNITDFRLALVHAVNYTDIIHTILTFNGTAYGGMYVGPISPGMPYYDPEGYPPYSYNLTLAEQYINEAGQQGDFYVTLPNGSTLGNSNGQPLKPLTIYTLTPVTPTEETEFEIIQKDLSQIGVSVSLYPVEASVTDTWTTASETPALVMLGWFPDWPDSVYQQLIVQTSPAFGGLAGNLAWVNNSQLNALYNTLPWETNKTQQEEGVAQAYTIIYNQAPYLWLPEGYTYWFQQPYLHGVVYNPFVGYRYNTMYYSNYTITYNITTS
ncbi:MAG: ABC transporter substrate-binding protein, partial [Thermoprotei archaeon]